MITASISRTFTKSLTTANVQTLCPAEKLSVRYPKRDSAVYASVVLPVPGGPTKNNDRPTPLLAKYCTSDSISTARVDGATLGSILTNDAGLSFIGGRTKKK